MKSSEEIKILTDLKAQLIKSNTEIQAKIEALQAAVEAAGDEVPEGVVAALNDLLPAAQTLDDIVPDNPGPVTPPTPEA